ncbi:MFS transporter [Aspergillus brunneoviolaceus CBS 621.78]|uniref:MFS transporter n=1 Tax=Aspergillus brunneoviolaceus CBS 621.78 TaxID=1450534 RepID=A0ACD1G872_9EURO|nr:MFS transporter [Aspergillus brunneoviolaceus CBS 621.78]RAH45491.1 MFS transporter [Aspergillus brunneoviolaceus CBS 621.78]
MTTNLLGADEALETSSLLPGPREQSFQNKTTPRRSKWILLFVCLIIVTLDFGVYLAVAPQLQIYENIICQRMHPELFASAFGGLTATTQPLCKSTDVQGKLALLVGWQDTFTQLPGMILAIPFGLMADQVGRKPVIIISLAGFLMQECAIRFICWNHTSIPLEAVWFAPLFQVFGGGSQIASSVAWTVIADVFPVDQRANAYLLMAAAMLLSQILAAPLSAWLMSKDVWMPSLLGLAIEVCGIIPIFALPETGPKASIGSNEDIESEAQGQASEHPTMRWTAIVHLVQSQLIEVVGFVWGNANTLAIFFAFLTSSIGSQALQFVLQYASKRFMWSVAEATFLISLKGVVNLVAFIIILPLISRILGGYLSPIRRDLRITHGSICVLMAGFGIMSVAVHPALFGIGLSFSALGWGFYTTLRSVGSALVAETHVGLFNTTIALAEAVGSMIAGPLLAALLKAGMAWEGAWMGLPWMVATGLYLLAGLAVSCIRTSAH